MIYSLQDTIVGWLKSQGVVAKPCGTTVAVSRDSMCNSKFAGPGFPEETTYPKVLEAIRREFPVLHGYQWIGKTDDDLFLDVI